MCLNLFNRLLLMVHHLTTEELLQRLVLSQHLDREPASSGLHAAQREALQPGGEGGIREAPAGAADRQRTNV